ncbi:LysR substrate binding domain-containing protein [Prauserella aidingensis]|nr:LysR substrate binding domain-containing protein [Prauserella aidingensis]
MELQQLRYVLAVADTMSFTRAAQRCFVVQSSLSHQVKALEGELGVRLFARTSRRVELTEAGAAFLPGARAALESADRAAQEAAAATGEVRGQVTIGTIPTLTAVDLPGVLRRFCGRHPHVGVTSRTGNSDDLAAAVRAGEIDVAFLGLPDTTEPRGGSPGNASSRSCPATTGSPTGAASTSGTWPTNRSPTSLPGVRAAPRATTRSPPPT